MNSEELMLIVEFDVSNNFYSNDANSVGTFFISYLGIVHLVRTQNFPKN